MILSEILKHVKPSPTIAMANMAKRLKSEGVKVYDFTLGEPDFNTPEHVKTAVKQAMDQDETRYTLINGTQALRVEICKKLKNENNLEYTPDEICVTHGAKHGIFNVMLASLNPGDEVIIVNPAWVSYIDIVKIASGTPVQITTTIDENFVLSAEKLRSSITNKTKWIMLNSPSNPTGVVYSKEDLRKIADVLLENPHVAVMSDEIYEHIIFDNIKHVSILEVEPKLADRAVIINGASKAYCMTGFRIGYLATKDKELLKAINLLQSQETASANAIGQYALQIAINDSRSKEYIAKMNKEMQARRDHIVAEFEKNNIRNFKPNGAFYVFADIAAFVGKKTKNGEKIESDIDFCRLLLSETGVAVVAGSAFGAENHFRLSFSCDMETVIAGTAKIVEFSKSLI